MLHCHTQSQPQRCTAQACTENPGEEGEHKKTCRARQHQQSPRAVVQATDERHVHGCTVQPEYVVAWSNKSLSHSDRRTIRGRAFCFATGKRGSVVSEQTIEVSVVPSQAIILGGRSAPSPSAEGQGKWVRQANAPLVPG